MSERDLVSFHTTEEDREIQEKEIILTGQDEA